MTCDFRLLRIAEDELFGEGIFGCGESDLGLGTVGLCGRDTDRRVRKLGPEALEFNILGLENDKVLEVRVHRRTA
jgi:hypothetical protein